MTSKQIEMREAFEEWLRSPDSGDQNTTNIIRLWKCWQAAQQHQEPREVDARHKKFFDWFWSAYCDQAMDMEDAQAALEYLLDLGLIISEPYDPLVHGSAGENDWGVEEGDPWYSRAKLPLQPTPAIAGDVVYALRELIRIKDQKIEYGKHTVHEKETEAAWDHARSAIASLTEQKASDGWRDIASAPRDGTPVIIYHPEGGVCEAFCPKDGFAWHCMDGTNTVIGEKSRVPIPRLTSFITPPTHWQPLPLPPGSSKAEVES